MPEAARQTDFHTCPMSNPGTPPVPHIGGPIIDGNFNVFIGGLPAATAGSKCFCTGSVDTIIQGSSTVFISGKPAARMGDLTAHGGKVSTGCINVIIGG